MAKSNKVIITCAVTGAIHTPSMSPHLPVTPEEIADAAIGAAEAGAAIVHLHARDPQTGKPDQTPGRLRAVSAGDQAAHRLRHQPHHRRRSLHDRRGAASPGGDVQAGGRLAQHGLDELRPVPDAEPLQGVQARLGAQHLENSRDLVFRNTFEDIEYVLRTCSENGTRFEFECYDTSHLYNLAHFLDRGLVKGPLFVQTVFGILGGIGAHPDDVMHMKRTADRLFGDDYRWSVLGAGRNQMPIAAMAAAMGGNVRVGLEDSLWDGPGKLAESNATQVRRVRQILEGLGLEIATPAEAREILDLKGGDQVEF